MKKEKYCQEWGRVPQRAYIFVIFFSSRSVQCSPGKSASPAPALEEALAMNMSRRWEHWQYLHSCYFSHAGVSPAPQTSFLPGSCPCSQTGKGILLLYSLLHPPLRCQGVPTLGGPGPPFPLLHHQPGDTDCLSPPPPSRPPCWSPQSVSYYWWQSWVWQSTGLILSHYFTTLLLSYYLPLLLSYYLRLDLLPYFPTLSLSDYFTCPTLLLSYYLPLLLSYYLPLDLLSYFPTINLYDYFTCPTLLLSYYLPLLLSYYLPLDLLSYFPTLLLSSSPTVLLFYYLPLLLSYSLTLNHSDYFTCSLLLFYFDSTFPTLQLFDYIEEECLLKTSQ